MRQPCVRIFVERVAPEPLGILVGRALIKSRDRQSDQEDEPTCFHYSGNERSRPRFGGLRTLLFDADSSEFGGSRSDKRNDPRQREILPMIGNRSVAEKVDIQKPEYRQ